MSINPVTVDVHALDTRFSGIDLSAEEWIIANDTILKVAKLEQLGRHHMLNDLMQYRSKCGPQFGDPVGL